MSNPPSLPPGTYTLTVTASDGTVVGSGTWVVVATAPDPMPMPPVVPVVPPPVINPAITRAALEASARAEALAYIPPEAMSMGSMDPDMLAALALVPLPVMTALAIQSGDWSDAATWLGERVPTAGDYAWVMPNRVVTIDTVGAVCCTLRNTGTLVFPSDRDSLLTLHTLINDPSGSLVMGMPGQPIAPQFTARVLYSDATKPDPALDPTHLGLGYINLGRRVINGSPVTHMLALAAPLKAGATALALKAAPDGWKPGDEIDVAATEFASPSQCERVVIGSVNGTGVLFTPALKYDHAAPTQAGLAALYGKGVPGSPLECHVAHLTRNACFDAARPGTAHVMNMSPDVQDSWACFCDGGRTDKARPLDPATNPRGRYPYHHHRVGTGGTPIKVVGCVVDGSPGWGFVNHSSNVHFLDCVAVDCVGAGFVSEASDERGSWANNLALNMTGFPGDSPSNLRQDARLAINDWGYSGHGLWDQSPYTTRSNNTASGCASVAFVRYPTEINNPPANLNNTTCAPDDGSTAYASLYGSYTYESNPDTPSQVTGLTVWACRYSAFGIAYSGGVAVSGFRFVGNGPGSGAAVALDNGRNVSFETGYCVGFDVGLQPGAGGALNAIAGCYLCNTVDVLIAKTNNDYCASLGTRVVTMVGNTYNGGGIHLDGTIAPLSPVNAPSWTCRLAPESLTLKGQQLYYAEQSPSQTLDSPFARLDGKTNAEAWRDCGVAYAGMVTPTNASPMAGLSGGSCGPANPPPPGPLIPGAAYPHTDGVYVDLMWADADNGGALIQDTQLRSNLKPGWMASFVADSQKRNRVGFRKNP